MQATMFLVFSVFSFEPHYVALASKPDEVELSLIRIQEIWRRTGSRFRMSRPRTDHRLVSMNGSLAMRSAVLSNLMSLKGVIVREFGHPPGLFVVSWDPFELEHDTVCENGERHWLD